MRATWTGLVRNTRWFNVIAVISVAGAVTISVAMMRPLAVEIATPEQNVRAAVFGLGTVEARILSKIGFEIGGILAELNVDHGDSVRAGEILGRLHSAKQEARVTKALSGLSNAEAVLKRAEAAAAKARTQLAQRKRVNQRRQVLLEKQFVSEEAAQLAQMDEDVATSDVAVTAADIEVARAAVEDAKSQHTYEKALLENHTLRAPYDAIVVTRHKELGSALANGEALFTLVDPKTVWVLAYIDESRAGPLRVGQVAVVRLRSLPGQIFTGRVARIGFESDRVTEERRVYVTCENCPAQFHLGEQAEVEIDLAVLPTVPLIPEAAISEFDGRSGTVWTVENGALRRRTVTFGNRTLDARVELASGLPSGASVVVEPKTGLREGLAATITSRVAR